MTIIRIKNKNNINNVKYMLRERAPVGVAVDLHAAVVCCCGSCACGHNSFAVASAGALPGYYWLCCGGVDGFGGLIVW